jgi:hypothetical protein
MEREPRGPSGKDAGAAAQQRCVRLRGRSMVVIRGRDTCALFSGRRTSADEASQRLGAEKAEGRLVDSHCVGFENLLDDLPLE